MARRTETGDAPQAPRREADLAARWAAGVWRGETLRAQSGARFRLIFEGRRNGGPGPDFRDAVLETEQGARLLGDIELHLRARDWLAHGHHTDTRYNRVILHVALDGASACSPLASGQTTPVVSLSFASATTLAPAQPGWPCDGLRARAGEVALRATLLWAGLERCEQRVRVFAEALRIAGETLVPSQLPWTAADRILWVALAEALGYGPNRAALCQAGIQLLAGNPPDVMAARTRRGERAPAWAANPLGTMERDGTMGAATSRGRTARLGGRGRPARPWRRYLRGPRAHHGGERRRSLRGGVGGPDRRRGARRSRPRALSRIARIAVESDYPRDGPAAWPRGAACRGGGAAGAASPLGGLVPREGMLALPLQSTRFDSAIRFQWPLLYPL